MSRKLGAVLAASLLFSTIANAALINLSPFLVIQYELFDQPDANWVLSNGNTIATQTVNADASILLSNFDITNKTINGTWRVQTSSDDDFMGFVFGYQGRGKYYLFDWKQSDQNDPLGFAQQGMSIKSVNVGGNGDPSGYDLWPTNGSSSVSLLYHNTIPWEDFKSYSFHLEFHPGQFTMEVRDGSAILMSQIVNDSTFKSGKFGFYNYSQGAVEYQGFTVDPAPPIPEPATLALVSIGIAALYQSRRKAVQATNYLT